jgi:hypothetical protein
MEKALTGFEHIEKLKNENAKVERESFLPIL